MPDQWIETPGFATRYRMESRGDGPVLVLVHEMGGTLESFDPVIGQLDRPVLRYDMRGFGLASKAVKVQQMSGLGTDLVALLDALQIAGPCDIAGVAVGGAVALHVAAHHPGRVRSVFATSPVTGIAGDRRPGLLELADRMEADGLAPLADSWLATGWPERQRTDPALFAAYRARWLGNDPRSFAATYRMLATLGMEDDLPRIACPAMIVGARQDAFRPAEAVRKAAGLIPGATYCEVHGGHFLPLQQPQLYADLLAGWLTRR